MGEGLKRATAAAKATLKANAERQLIEATFRDWWHMEARHGMTASEAGASLMAAFNAARLKIIKV
jgi:hypothetical protein